VGNGLCRNWNRAEVGSREKRSKGLGSEYEELVNPSGLPQDGGPSTKKIVLWLLLFWPVGFYFLTRRFRRSRVVAVLVATLSLVVLLGILGAVLGSGGTSPSAAKAPEQQKPAKTSAQLRAERRHQALIARQKVRAKEKAARIARERARARAQAHAAYVAAANRWHQGYRPYDYGLGIYYRWRDNLGCASYSDYCWRIEVITRRGCTSLFVEANETNASRTIIGDLIDSRDNIPPRTPALFELDSTSGATSSYASAVKITCNQY
jgi:hypothetical protein